MTNVIIYHTDIDRKTATPDDLDVFDQADFVEKNLIGLGYKPVQMPFNLEKAKGEIERINPLFVFNLVEVINGQESLNYLAPKLFEQTQTPYTGCTMNSFRKLATKTCAKDILVKNNIPTPFYLTHKDMCSRKFQRKSFIIKSVADHASKGLEAILYNSENKLLEALQLKGPNFFAEEYIDGREFNVSVMGSVGKATVLPVAEIQFKDWKPGKLKIVDYSAKWDANAHEYNATVRNFDFPNQDKNLIKTLENVCKKCWNLFDLRGYARVDFRVSKHGIPYVLEINANPCISPDAGFIAAAERAEMTHKQVISKIIEDSCKA